MLHFELLISGRIRITESLIKNVADLNVQDKSGRTPLSKAIQFGHLIYYLLNLYMCGYAYSHVIDWLLNF